MEPSDPVEVVRTSLPGQGPPGLQGPRGSAGKVVVIGPNKTAQVLKGLGIFLVGLSMVLSQLFSWNEVHSVHGQLDDITEDRAMEQIAEDCLNLYRNDLNLAIGKAIAANNALWVSVAGREAALTDEERTEAATENQRLGRILSQQNTPLVDAIEALERYSAIDPPPNFCPHPSRVDDPEAIDG